MKNVLVLLHDDPGQGPRLQAALDATRALNGHLICVDVAIMPATAFDRSLDAERVTEAANRQKVEQQLKTEGVSWHWIEAADYVDTAVVNACKLADLIVVNSEIANVRIGSVRRIAGDLVVECGKPILAVPASARGFDVAGDALVAWNGSDPATAALTAAMPIVQFAESVTLFEVDDGSLGAPAEEAATYLSRHGVQAEILRERAPSRKVDDLLLHKAKSGGFSYVVMGAYSRPRGLEALFGGVTRRMLRDSPVPLLLAH